MNVLLINGSPHKQGCTYTALKEAETVLKAAGVQTEICSLGTAPIRGCIACGKCRDNRCIFGDDIVNTIIEKAEQADGVIIGSPVYYSSPNGTLLSALDRAFYAGSRAFAYKPAAAVVSARRAGTTASLDALTKYFTINHMPVVSSQYWCMVHGNTPEDVAQDAEGLQIMRTLARNMSWLLSCIEKGKQAGISIPIAPEERQRTNFIR